MKKYLLIGTLFLSILTSCSIDWNDEKDSKKQNMELKQNDDVSFKKRGECAKHKDYMLKEAIDYHKEWMARIGDEYDLKIEEIFYSPKLDSCIYQLSIYKYNDFGNGTERFLLNKYLYDYFSKKEISSTVSDNTYYDAETAKIKEKEFTEKIQELKGE